MPTGMGTALFGLTGAGLRGKGAELRGLGGEGTQGGGGDGLVGGGGGGGGGERLTVPKLNWGGGGGGRLVGGGGEVARGRVELMNTAVVAVWPHQPGQQRNTRCLRTAHLHRPSCAKHRHESDRQLFASIQ